MQATGQRNVPSIRYLQTRHALRFDKEGKASGGFFWDGRASSLQTQAAEPLLNPLEMANKDADEVVKKLSQAAYAKQFAALNGQAIWQHPGQAFAAMTQALAAYQREDPDLQRFDSRFDRVMQGRATFSSSEERGWALFKDTKKAIAPPVTRPNPPLTARQRCSPTTVTTTWACRATLTCCARQVTAATTWACATPNS